VLLPVVQLMIFFCYSYVKYYAILVIFSLLLSKTVLQCFDAVGWAAGRASGLKKLSGEVLAWLSV